MKSKQICLSPSATAWDARTRKIQHHECPARTVPQAGRATVKSLVHLECHNRKTETRRPSMDTIPQGGIR